MEFGDIIYFILLVFFVILGFFNDSRKKKQEQQKQQEAKRQPEETLRPFWEESGEPTFAPQTKRKSPAIPPPAPVAVSAKDRYDQFQSSLDLVSIHQEPSTLSSYTFDYDANSFYEKDTDSLDIPDEIKEENRIKVIHPWIKELRDISARDQLKKGLIYGEIMQKKW